LFDNLLDENGSVEVQWKVPDLTNAPSSIIVKLDAEVLEKGGRGSKKKIYLPLDPFEYYVGIESRSDSWVKIGKPSNFNVILLDDEGNPQTEEELIVRIYRNNNYWWWEFDNRNQARLHFKSDTETEMLREEKILSQAKPVEFEFIPQRWGEYLIEVSHNNKDGKGHTASRFFNASYWGRTIGGMQNAGAITLKTDRPVYHPGEKAEAGFY
jgi:uncharacterized protein YfaS (alpha-2-macroglobulin family)